MKEGYFPEIFEKQRLDKKINVEDEEAYEMARRLTKEAGIFVGMSSGAAMAGALREAAQMADGTIVVILPDNGERYLSTPLYTIRDETALRFFNTLTRKKDSFVPRLPEMVSLYSCGPTAHSRIHLGEMRLFVFADLLRRYLELKGYSVKHIIDINDFDDKAISGSQKAGLDLAEFTDAHIQRFFEDISILGIKSADKYPRASENVEEMIALCEKLVMKGLAYEKLRSLYFDISRQADYGRLSGIDINKIKIGATVDLDDYEKENPRDFTLFKRSKLSELKRGIFVKTQWGNVRPSWHIKSAAMALKFLGECFDIHTSSRELIFPHHENENAIATALTRKPLAKFWVLCDRVLIDGKKLDEKGLGLTLSDLIKMGYSGRAVRYWLLSSHYRKPIPFSIERLDNAQRSLERLDRCLSSLRKVKPGPAYPELEQLLYDLKRGFSDAMDDDLNISAALASIFSIVKKINTLILKKRLHAAGASKIVDEFRRIDAVLNIFDFVDADADPEIQQLIKKRDKARSEKNWELADQIRNELRSQGVIIQDQKLKS
jgi:cysteinyl-tRNA synthetase